MIRSTINILVKCCLISCLDVWNKETFWIMSDITSGPLHSLKISCMVILFLVLRVIQRARSRGEWNWGGESLFKLQHKIKLALHYHTSWLFLNIIGTLQCHFILSFPSILFYSRVYINVVYDGWYKQRYTGFTCCFVCMPSETK